MVLSDLKPGQSGLITDYRPQSEEELKLMELGLVKGEEVKLTNIAPLGDPIQVEIMNYSLCVRKENAKNIKVERY